MPDVAVQTLTGQSRQGTSFRRIGRMQRLPCWAQLAPGSSLTAPFQMPSPAAQVCSALFWHHALLPPALHCGKAYPKRWPVLCSLLDAHLARCVPNTCMP